MVTLDLLNRIIEAVQVYNRFRSPEARAYILSIHGNTVRVLIEGCYCETCGVYDWIEDLVYCMEDEGVNAKIKEFIEPRDPLEPWRIVVLEVSEGLIP